MTSTNYNWEDYCYAYYFRVIEQGKFLRDIDVHLHPKTLEINTYITQFLHQYHQLPTYQHLQERYNLHFATHALSQFSMNELRDRIKLERVKSLATEALYKLQDALSSDDATISSIIEPAIQLQEQSLNADDTRVRWLSEYGDILKEFQEAGGDLVANFGHQRLDLFSGGIRKGDYIIIYGPTGKGKSTFARSFATNIAEQGKRVLYFTLEEPADRSVLKAVSVKYEIDSKKLTRNEWGMDEYYKLLNYEIKGNIAFIDKLSNYTIGDLMKHIHHIQPDVIFIDQINHLATNKNKALWEALTWISKDVRRLGQTTEIPIIGLMQANRQAGKSKDDVEPTLEESFGDAYNVTRDATHVFFIHPDISANGYIRKRLTQLKCRDGEAHQSIDFEMNLGNGILREEAVAYGVLSTHPQQLAQEPTINNAHPNPAPVSIQQLDGVRMADSQAGSSGVQHAGVINPFRKGQISNQQEAVQNIQQVRYDG